MQLHIDVPTFFIGAMNSLYVHSCTGFAFPEELTRKFTRKDKNGHVVLKRRAAENM